ncbi:MAG TPA: hypothetical protein VGQ83_11685 [Polyangia bacterium]|jgi:hypothetical protein
MKKLRPARHAPDPGYPSFTRRFVHGALLAATVTATSLGGCGPVVNPPQVDAAVDRGDLDGTVDGATNARAARPAPAPAPAPAPLPGAVPPPAPPPKPR